MNRSFIVAVLTVTMFIMMATAGYALTAPHNFKCSDCHGKFTAGGSVGAVAGSTKACPSCHTSSGEAFRMPAADSMSNYFGSVAGQPSTGSKSSHSWEASSPHVPSKSQEPLNTALNDGTAVGILVGTTLCNRCHDAKGTNAIKPFLRVSNTNDALCLDCHRARQTSTAATGSHPVAYRAYSTVYKLNTTAFRKTPVSANVYNPTANPGNYLKSGKIVCSTCHAPHYADSSSSTFKNRSTANGFAVDDPAKGLKGNLQNSKGQLLRTDALGASATAINVCSSCHKESKNRSHNGKGQNIQCDHCHGAHVDYMADGSAPNLYLVRRDFSNFSATSIKLGANVKVIYNSATSLRFKRADGNGICQICHAPTPGVAIHDNTDTHKADCIGCHKHSDGFKAANCTSCHGQPPVTSTVGGPNGKASASYTLDEALTPHATHADSAYYNFGCNNCHYNGTPQANHNNGSFASVFIDTAGSIGTGAGYPNTPANYNASARKCSNVYCHSNGSPRGAVAMKMYTTPSWELGRNKILGTSTECASCHGIGASLTTNAHDRHVNINNIKCYVCHNATVTSTPAIKDRTKHANGTKDVKFITRPPNFFGVFSSTWNSAAGTCNTSCHTNGLGVSPATPAKWTDPTTGACGTCHNAVPNTSLHSKHFTDVAGPQLGTAPTVCANCHDYAAGASTHANGKIDLRSGNPCAPCHQSAAPIWAFGATVTCESCHTGTLSVVNTYTAPSVDLFKPAGHGKYSSASLKRVVCSTCHDNSKPHIRPAVALKRLKYATSNDVCAACHTTAAAMGLPEARIDLPVHGGPVNPFAHYTTTNDSSARNCAGCHDPHGTSNYMNIRVKINNQTVTYLNTTSLTRFVVQTPNANGLYNGLCQVCHTKTNHYRNNQPTSFGAHYTTNCLGCHTHKGAFAFLPSNGTCDSCHGYPPVRNTSGLGTIGNYSGARYQDYSGGGGAHSVAGHIPRTARQGQALNNCTNCHNINFGTDHNTGGAPPKKPYVNVIVDTQFKFNNASTIRYNGQSCSNVSCHFKPSPSWLTSN